MATAPHRTKNLGMPITLGQAIAELQKNLPARETGEHHRQLWAALGQGAIRAVSPFLQNIAALDCQLFEARHSDADVKRCIEQSTVPDAEGSPQQVRVFSQELSTYFRISIDPRFMELVRQHARKEPIISVSRSKRQIRFRGKDLKLSPRSFEILSALAEMKGASVTVAEFDRLRITNAESELSKNVHKLKAQMKQSGVVPEDIALIKNVRPAGYRLDIDPSLIRLET